MQKQHEDDRLNSCEHIARYILNKKVLAIAPKMQKAQGNNTSNYKQRTERRRTKLEPRSSIVQKNKQNNTLIYEVTQKTRQHRTGSYHPKQNQ